ncbi:MAG: DUF4461 domain-containing protein [Thermodesulfobacteriota bacterium]|nr:DUF4461 domain-containing protein [Thermodesulfobacteriota bacterium]
MEANIKTLLELNYITGSLGLSDADYEKGLANIGKKAEWLKQKQIKGLSICVGSNFRVYDRHFFVLPHDFSKKDMERFLKENLGRDGFFRVPSMEVQEKELEIKMRNLLGNQKIYRQSFIDSESYIQGLNTLLSCSEPLKQFDLSDFSIYIADRFDISDSGSFYIEYNATPEKIIHFFLVNREKAVKKAEKYSKMVKKIRKLEKELCQQIGFKRIVQSVYVSLEQYNACLNKLLNFHCAGKLKEEGANNVTLFVSDDYKISPYGDIYIY